MQTAWLLGGLGVGVGLMYLLDPDKGAARGDTVRRVVGDSGHQIGMALLTPGGPWVGWGKRPSSGRVGRSDASRGWRNDCGQRPRGGALPGPLSPGRCRTGDGAELCPGPPGRSPAACPAARESACLLAHHGPPSGAPARAAQSLALLPRAGHPACGRPHPQAGPGRGLCGGGRLRGDRAL